MSDSDLRDDMITFSGNCFPSRAPAPPSPSREAAAPPQSDSMSLGLGRSSVATSSSLLLTGTTDVLPSTVDRSASGFGRAVL
jgi:hypothetical protein